MSINRVVVSGNLTRDPELSVTGGGMAILKLGIAVNDRRKVDGEWTDVPGFFDVKMFGTRAESLSRYLSKGSKVAVEGKLSYQSWEDKNTGAKRSKVEILADDIDLMSREHGAAPKQQGQCNSEPADEDIPF